MFRIRIARYTLDVLPEVMAECKRRGLAQNFDCQSECCYGDWLNNHRSMNVMADVGCVQLLYGVTIYIEVK